MKKIFLVLAAMFCVATVSAQSQWAAGLRIGSGLQAQGEWAYSDNCYVEARFGMSWLPNTGWMGPEGSGITADFTALHNWNVCNWDWTPSVGKWFLDAGCGLNLGGRPHNYGYGVKGSHFYVGAAGQVKFGLKFDKVPIRLAVDWTPVLGAEVYTVKYDGTKIDNAGPKGKNAGFYALGLANIAVSAVWCF